MVGHVDGYRHSVTSADGTKIGLLTAGEGPPLLLVHGGMGQIESWQSLWPALTGRWRVTAMDRRGRGASAPPKTIEIPRSPRWVVFSIGVDASQFQTYRATLRNQAGQPIWQKDDVQPSSPDTIAIPVLSTLLTPGNYNLSLEGWAASGRNVPVSTFSMQVKSTH